MGFHEDERIRHKNRDLKDPQLSHEEKTFTLTLTGKVAVSDVLQSLKREGFSVIVEENNKIVIA